MAVSKPAPSKSNQSAAATSLEPVELKPSAQVLHAEACNEATSQNPRSFPLSSVKEEVQNEKEEYDEEEETKKDDFFQDIEEIKEDVE